MLELVKTTIKDASILLEIERTVTGLKIYSGYFSEEEVVEWVGNENVFLIKNDGVIVGSISYEVKDSEHAHISGLVIKPEFQRMGYAKKAMVLMLDKLKNFKTLQLEVHPENHALILYESLGFKMQSRKDNYFGDGEPRLIMIRNQS